MTFDLRWGRSKRHAPKPAVAKARTAKAVVELAPDAAPAAEA